MSDTRVVNTSPLIHLSRAGMLELLRVGDNPVLVPPAVFDEVMAGPTADAAQKAISSMSWLVVAAIEPVPAVVTAWDLGSGESAVLAYGVHRPGVEVIVDDLAARRCGAALGIPVRGTLGLVLLAKQQGRIVSARAALEKLRKAGMHLSDAVMNGALRLIGE